MKVFLNADIHSVVSSSPVSERKIEKGKAERDTRIKLKAEFKIIIKKRKEERNLRKGKTEKRECWTEEKEWEKKKQGKKSNVKSNKSIKE